PRAHRDTRLPAELREAAQTPDALTPEQREALREHWLRRVCADTRPLFDELEARPADVTARPERLGAEIPTTLVMRERPEPRATFVLKRGEYDRPGEQVTRGTPAMLPEMAPDLPRDRLGLARWVVDPGHPLTARVAVNRFWQQLFGIGLVE